MKLSFSPKLFSKTWINQEKKALLLDLATAFNSISRKIFLEKIKMYGFSKMHQATQTSF